MLNRINVRSVFHVVCSANWVQGSADLVCQGCVGPSAAALTEREGKPGNTVGNWRGGMEKKGGRACFRVCASVVMAIEVPVCGAMGDGCFVPAALTEPLPPTPRAIPPL